MSKKVLIITYYWPPGSGPGVQRWLKFVKFLPQFGWNPTVLTVKGGSYPATDTTLEADVPDSVEIHKTQALEPFRIFNLLKGKKGKDSPVGMGDMHKSKSWVSRLGLWIRANYFIPDARVGWNPYAYKKATELIRDHAFDAVITTGPPHSTHLIGQQLKEKFGVKWLADFRDPWTTIYYNKYLPRTASANAKDQQLETSVLKASDGVLTVSPGLEAELADRAKRVKVLFNGFDDDDFSEEPEKTKFFSLSYIGNFKDNQDVTELWNAIIELKEENTSFAKDFRLELTGNVAPRVDALLQDKLGESYEKFDFVQHKEAVKRMKGSGSLLFIIPQSTNNSLILTGKIFEYLATGTPMLSIGPVNGNAAAIVANCSQEPMLHYGDRDGIKKVLLRQYNDFKSDKVTTRSKAVETYGRRGQTEVLASFLNEITTL